MLAFGAAWHLDKGFTEFLKVICVDDQLALVYSH